MSLETFFNHDKDFSKVVQPFSFGHLMFIICALLSIVVTFYFAKKIYNCKYEKKIRYFFAGWLLFLELLYHFHYWLYGMFSVPLHICSFGAMFSIGLLLTNKQKYFNVLFFVGICGGTLALVIPNSLGYTYYNMRYYHYILLHMSIIIVPVYYFRAYGLRVQFKDVIQTYIKVLCVLPLVVTVNYVFNKNYMFIGEKPRVLFNVLPVWPYYIFVFAFIAVFLFYGLYKISDLVTKLEMKKIGAIENDSIKNN